MPKIQITERDITGQIQQSNISNTVFVPIRINPFDGYQYGDTEIKKQKDGRSTYPLLYTSASKLHDDFVGETVNGIDPKEGLVNRLTSMDYKICKHLINLGFDVLVQGWITTGDIDTTVKSYTAKTNAFKTTSIALLKQINKPQSGWPSIAEGASSLTKEQLGIAADPTYDPANLEIGNGWTDEWILVNGNSRNFGILGYPDVNDPESVQTFISQNQSKFVETETHDKDTNHEFTLSEVIPSSSSVTECYFVNPKINTVINGDGATYSYFYGLTETGIGDVTASKPDADASSTTIYCIVTASSDIAYLPNDSVAGTITISDYSINQGMSEQGWKDLRDKGLYDIRFLTAGMFSCEAAKQSMTTCAASRGDCIALLHADENRAGFSYDPLYELVDEIDPETGKPTGRKVEDGFRGRFRVTDGEYAAGFTPWFYSRNPDLGNYNSDTGTVDRVEIPASYAYLFAYANSLKNNPEWYAVAGFQRGIIPELEGVFHDFTSAEIEQLQARAVDDVVDLDENSDNVGFAINPIANIRPAGYIIWGNRTLRVNDAAKKTIATSFLNVRNGVSAIKKVLYTAAKKYTFEQNNDILWTNFQAYTRPLLDKMQSGNGLAGYRWIKLQTTAKARLKAQLRIIPIEAVEDFELEVLLTDDLEVSE